jgi:galactokinase
MQIPATLLPAFAEAFGGRPRLFRAPGRVNLIGEHTDYTGGLVMPAAIHFSTWVAAGRREDRTIRAVSEGFPGALEFSLDLTPKCQGNWTDYVAGVAAMLEAAGYRLRGANLLIHGEVPVGSGLSSSAAIEVATALALLKNSDLFMEPMQLALLCQRAENEFVGIRCGIMDQFISCYGLAGHALLLDCRSLEFWPVALPPNVHLIICNTMVRHELAASEYNARRAECEEGVRKLGEVLPGIRALRDVTLAQLQEHRGRLNDQVFRRCRHIITENDRVCQARSAFQIGAVGELCHLMADSHRSLRDDYEVSCRELDVMVEIGSRQRGIYGARMTGGGFGGCTINLVDAADSAEFQRRVSAEYQHATGLRPDIYVCEASQGAEAIEPAAEDLKGGAQ